MTKYIDARGVTWDSALEALNDYISDLPPLTDEETEMLFSSTQHDWPPERNLAAIEFAVHYHGLSEKLGYYPVPQPWDEHAVQHYVPARDQLLDRAFEDQGWMWGPVDPWFMMAVSPSWDSAHVPFFQQQRQAFNRRLLATLGKEYEQPSPDDARYFPSMGMPT